MTIKQKLENNLTVFAITVAVAAFSSGWGACEIVRVTNKTEKIADLEKKIADQSQQIKDSNVAIEPYQKQITDLLSKTQRLEADLNNSQSNLTQWQQSLNSWKIAHEKIQNELNLYASNCSVISHIRAVESKKENIENSLATAQINNPGSIRIDDYKRQISEYQSRLVSLQERLACIPR